MTVCNEWSNIESWTLTTDSVSVSVSDIWTLQYLNRLVGDASGTVCDWICSRTNTANVFSVDG